MSITSRFPHLFPCGACRNSGTETNSLLWHHQILISLGGTSGQGRRSHEVEQFGDPVQQPLHRAGAWQMQFDPILVLHHPHRQLEQLQDDAHRLRLRQLGMVQGVLAQAVDQVVSSTGIEQAQVVGEKGMVGRAIAGQIILHRLDEVLVLSPRAVQVPVQCPRRRVGQRRHDKARVVPQSHDLDLEHHAVGRARPLVEEPCIFRKDAAPSAHKLVFRDRAGSFYRAVSLHFRRRCRRQLQVRGCCRT
jgi:hypothetical protein